MEAEIISVEERISELERLMSGADFFSDAERSGTAVAEHAELAARLPELNARWEELGTQLETLEAASTSPAEPLS